MELCSKCDEPAAKVMFTSSAMSPVNFCYVHAVEENLLDASLESAQVIAAETGFCVNAVFFVAEAIIRAESVRSAREVCAAVVKSARERFKTSSAGVMSRWGLLHGRNIGDIFVALCRDDILRVDDPIPREDFEESFTLIDVLDAP